MNVYTMNQLEEENSRADFNVIVTQEMLEIFQMMSGDYNPMHTNDKYAKEMGMNGKIVHGMLVAAFYSRLVGMYLPGKLCMLHEIKIYFNKPVYPGDSLNVSGVVEEKKELFQRVKINAKIINQFGEKVSSAKIMVGILNEL